MEALDHLQYHRQHLLPDADQQLLEVGHRLLELEPGRLGHDPECLVERAGRVGHVGEDLLRRRNVRTHEVHDAGQRSDVTEHRGGRCGVPVKLLGERLERRQEPFLPDLPP